MMHHNSSHMLFLPTTIVQMNSVMMVKHGFEVRQLQKNDHHYLHVVYEQTNLSSVSDTSAVAQEQFYFGPLHGSSEHHRAL